MLSRRPHGAYTKCNQTITIYRVVRVDGVETFPRTIIHNAFFDFRKVHNTNKLGQVETNSFLLVVPNTYNSISPIQIGDKIVLGEGAEVLNRVGYNDLIPSKVPNMAVIKYIDPKYFNGDIVHWEAGG